MLVIVVMNNVLVSYGAQSKYGADIPLATLGITMKVSNLITGVSLGIATGIQPILGYNYGSRQYDRVKRTYKLALFSATVILAIAFVIFQVFPEQIISIFGQESDLYMEFAVKCFRIYLCGCFMIGAGGVTGILFQAIGKPVPAALLSLSRQIIFLIPALLIFSYFFGVEGALWAGPFSDILSGVISLILQLWPSGRKYLQEEKRIRKNIIERSHVSEEDAEVISRKKDKPRSGHYYYYTGKKWGDSPDYHLCLDSSELGIERCVSIIEKIYLELNDT